MKAMGIEVDRELIRRAFRATMRALSKGLICSDENKVADPREENSDRRPHISLAAPSTQHSITLAAAAKLLPVKERDDWLEENCAYLADAQGWWNRTLWVARQFLAMPRYAYVVRTDNEKEPA